MTEKFEKTITFAIMKAELHEAHQAIADIWAAWFAWTVLDITDVSDFEEAMARGLSCLPPEYRTPEMPHSIPWRKEASATVVRERQRDAIDVPFVRISDDGDFDDILG